MRAIILDDEPNSAETLFLLLKRHCPEVQILGVENKPEVALPKINLHQPELLFLDIEMQSMTAFDLLPQLDFAFGVIFTTAHERFEYARQAINFEAVDYLTKPVDAIELVKAVEKAKSRFKFAVTAAHNSIVPHFIEKITVATTEGLLILRLPEFVRFESEGSYTYAIKMSGDKILISKNIGVVEKMLAHTTFIRTHRSHLVNLQHVEKYIHSDNSILLSNGNNVPLARQHKDEFFKAIKNLTAWMK